MKKTVHKNIRQLLKRGKGIFWSLVCLSFLVSSYYVYLMNTAALNGARWNGAETETALLGEKVSELESEYLSLKQSVTLSVAYERGFEDVKAVRFISGRKVGTAAAVNEI
ncbi:MAG: hypothetical protein A2W52_04830 [Candidatus Taylorbacteria bacterium RIFCSPHIGHO2_02_49_25]|uniref:Cell division protein FtsL n=1 Tax=Candidatus Taylorbacteria bacterium RIFCSPHIGHO2_02_49_25 TaxID=1802305 RepID=A0A1G2MES3_9BACT|nr:MAG: hypothetical protein A2759_02280 [Candidatus Taylorbacteria bacterium RIFCSPHIGHO2_01_FULL_49_60]OHA22367.1 MAG: hypothetical protein A2W52_04830 [Candidatus Taylorbacteria bacterium RIFCSPHIGHO2_02_49_25]OHA35847.1 MAG: hypothetical protein A2W65_03590 [Candidatus Taylorbacteria bacterium RIFCSPLOWO2_02_50_13]OHA37167.1 MAG: hypothetical protein A3B27_02660 [Candidatus Taylorbacteria bacterium RIFCSPLOWO2_01_FULL_50_130]OHA40575.1 MAG: hypothetical protein A3H73_02745 [Candidatus Taylo